MLLLLLRNKDARYLTTIAILFLALCIQRKSNESCVAQLNSRPKTEVKLETKYKKTQGPITIVSKKTKKNGDITETTTTKGQTVVEFEKSEKKKSEPVFVGTDSGSRWIVGTNTGIPLGKDLGVRVGYSFKNTLDFTIGSKIKSFEPGLDVAFRFR